MTAPAYGESTKRERVGWYFYDWANSAFSATIVAVFLGPYLSAIARSAAGCPDNTDACQAATLFHFAGIDFKAGGFYTLILSVAVGINVLILPVIGAIADRSAHKRRLLGIFAYIGAGATCGFFFVDAGRLWLGAALTIVATVAFAASIVVYQSFLPQLCPEDQRDKVSSYGWAFGYLGGGLLLVVNLAALQLLEDRLGTSLVVRLSMASAGIWWGLFTLLPLMRLRDRPPLEGVARGNVLTDGFKQLRHTLKGIRAYPITLLFLGAYLVYNDAIQTVINVSSIYGTEALKLSQDTLIITILIIQFLAFGGALGMGALAQRIGAKKTVLISLVLWTAIVGAAFSLPEGAPGPFMALGATVGLVLGGSQALSRSLFSQLIPKGKEAEYFGFYEISDKGTSWIGPLLFTAVFQFSGSYRVGIVSVLIPFIIGFVLLLLVPIRRGIVAAGNNPPPRL
ncbi:MFS transporter [Allorhizocola rhizosphaerae]|uniref:MFS transporter n=1 Tax=Allorhizocola rhizosphaerae TaxID=1872709 RepID=UPI000E3BE8C2|nr:MFS transporter [Allorhizocola rhizosphaerae]